MVAAAAVGMLATNPAGRPAVAAGSRLAVPRVAGFRRTTAAEAAVAASPAAVAAACHLSPDPP